MSAVIRFVPTDNIPPALANDIAVPVVPRVGESVYLQGIHYLVIDVAHFFNQTARTGQDGILISLERAR